jgi:hypothetical protein
MVSAALADDATAGAETDIRVSAMHKESMPQIKSFFIVVNPP